MSDLPSEGDESNLLPAPKLCNQLNNPNPILGKGALGHQAKGKMYYTGSDKKRLVEILQRMLLDLGYSLGSSGPDGDGVDGIFGDRTEASVRDFQEKHKGWDGTPLKVDCLVGPRTADCLNRAMVGKWYSHYQTPEELVEGVPHHTVTSKFLAEGLSIEPRDSEKAKVFLASSIPEGTPTFAEFVIFDEWDRPIPGLPISITSGIGESTLPTDDGGSVRFEDVLKGQVKVRIADFEQFAKITSRWQEREARCDPLPAEDDWRILTPCDLRRSVQYPTSERLRLMILTRSDIFFHSAYSAWKNPHLDPTDGPWMLTSGPEGIRLSLNSDGLGRIVTVQCSQPVMDSENDTKEVKWFEVDVDAFNDDRHHERLDKLASFFSDLTRNPPDEEV